MAKRMDERQEVYMKEVGSRIKELREQKGLSQTDLAKLVGYQYRSTINKIENGQRNITTNLIAKLAKVFNTTPAYLMGWTDDPNEEKSTKSQILELVEEMSEDKQKMLLDFIRSFTQN